MLQIDQTWVQARLAERRKKASYRRTVPRTPASSRARFLALLHYIYYYCKAWERSCPSEQTLLNFHCKNGSFPIEYSWYTSGCRSDHIYTFIRMCDGGILASCNFRIDIACSARENDLNFAILRSGSQCMHAAALILNTHPRMVFIQLCISVSSRRSHALGFWGDRASILTVSGPITLAIHTGEIWFSHH